MKPFSFFIARSASIVFTCGLAAVAQTSGTESEAFRGYMHDDATSTSVRTGYDVAPANFRIENTVTARVAPAAVQSGLVYTCNSSVGASICATLNSTIAGLYTDTFSNVNASIYVTFGTTSLGESRFPVFVTSYTSFRNALQSSLSGANDQTAFAASVPADNPFGSSTTVRLTTPNARALGLEPSGGFQGYTSDGATCSLNSAGCYDGIIIVSDSIRAAGRLYFRTGTIGINQFDFYMVIEHETDEILGTPSCAIGCTNRIFPPDLYRYQSNGSRSFAAGNNASCASANTGNACFSLDGVHMLQQYNNLDNGEDPGDWVPKCTGVLVQNAAACAGIAFVDISPAAEILVLDVIGYTLAGTTVTVAPVDARTSNAQGSVSSCIPPTSVTDFTTSSPQVWVFGSVTGARIGDTVRTLFVRPDGVNYTGALVSNIFSVGQNGAACFTVSLPINGAPATAFPGTWTVRMFWNQSTTPLFTLTFRLSAPVCNYALSSGGQTFPAGGGAAALGITSSPGCPWTVSGLPFWVTLSAPASGSGNGTATFSVLQNSGAYRTATITVGAIPFTFEQSALAITGLTRAGSLAHITSKGTWKFTLDAINLGASPAVARFNFAANAGDPLALPLTFPQSPSTGGPLLATTLDRTINANAHLTIESTGPNSDPILIGSGQMLTNGAISGFGIFSDPLLGWNAVVPLETRNAASYVLAFDNTTAACGDSCSNALVTGVAVANISSSAANISVIIRDDTGAQLGTAAIALPAQGHTSFMLNQEYPITANKRGTIEFDTPGFGTQSAGQISVLGLRANGPALTTLPVLASTDTPGGAIAHATYNGGFTSVFYLVNTGTTSANFTLSFFDESGSPLEAPLSLPQLGITTTTAVLTRPLAAGAMLVIETQAQDTMASIAGSAQLTTTGNISGFEIFRWTTFGQEASVPLETRTPSSFVLVFDDTSGLTTGVALANQSVATATITANIYDDTGALLQTSPISLPARGHTSFLLPDPARFPITANKRGMVEFVVPQSAKISAIGLRAKADGTLTTIPVLVK